MQLSDVREWYPPPCCSVRWSNVSRESGGTFSVLNIPVSNIYFCRPIAKKWGMRICPNPSSGVSGYELSFRHTANHTHLATAAREHPNINSVRDLMAYSSLFIDTIPHRPSVSSSYTCFCGLFQVSMY